MNKNLLLYILIFWASFVSAQDHQAVPLTRIFSISDSSNRIECSTLIQKIELTVNSNINYFWIKNNIVQKNKGGYSGSLLHGDFQKFNDDGQLIEKGMFFTGMKNGLWQYWDKKGDLIKSLNYNKGLLHGEAIQYLSDGAVIKTPYHKGLIHGKLLEVSKDTTLIEKYRHGVLIPKKVKSESGFKFRKLIFWKKAKNKSNEDSDKETIQSEA